MRALVTFALLLGLSGSAWAQTNAELIEKAVYLQDIVGDVDGAVAIYRQILKTPSAQSRAADIAQQRLAVLSGGSAAAGAARSGAMANRFRYAPLGVEFDVPAGWTVAAPVIGPDGTDTQLMHLTTGATVTVSMTNAADEGNELQFLPAAIRERWAPIEIRKEALSDGMILDDLVFQAAGKPADGALLRVLSLHRGKTRVSFLERLTKGDPRPFAAAWPRMLASISLPEGRF